MNFLFPRIQSWWLLWLSTVITISIVAASQLFTHRISLLLDRQASELLAADLLIGSNEKLPDSYLQLAEDYGLTTATTVSLRTAIFLLDEPQLVELKAVSSGYPLRGTLEYKFTLLGKPQKSPHGPKQGELWIDSKIAAQINRQIEIGLTALPASRILSYEPDRGGSLFNLAPRIMMHMDDLAATGLMIAGSRARYRLLVAGDLEPLKQFEQFIKPLLTEGQHLQTLENARPEMRNALLRTRQFFALSIVLTLVIAMIAIAITARYSASQEATKVAVLRTFGIVGSRLMGFYLQQIMKVWILSVPPGLLTGYLAQFPIQWALGHWFGGRLPDTNLWPFLLASLIGLVSLLGFSLPHILNLLDTPPMQVFRQTSRKISRYKAVLLITISLITLFIVLILIVKEIKLAGLLFILVLVIAGIIPLVLKLLLRALQSMGSNHFWLKSYVFSRLLSGHRNALFVMSGFSLTLISVLLISHVKDQLLEQWKLQLPQDKPNYFLVNIPTKDVEALTWFLSSRHIPASSAYALVRTRLAAINGRNVNQIGFDDIRAYNLIKHTFNISYADELPPDNTIVQGEWFGKHTAASGFSVEQGMATSLGLKLGDVLQFSIAGSFFEGTVINIRSVVWENFQPNFYILATREQLESKPQTWLMSAFLDDANRKILKPLLTQFPTVTLLDISELMQRIKGIIQRASLALEFFFAFATLSAIIVLLSALNTANQHRELEIALLQALGANKAQKLMSQIIEFMLMGILVGLFAALFATLIGWIVGHWFFDLPFLFSPGLWLYSLSVSVSVITLVGTVFIYRSLSISPMSLLRS